MPVGAKKVAEDFKPSRFFIPCNINHKTDKTKNAGQGRRHTRANQAKFWEAKITKNQKCIKPGIDDQRQHNQRERNGGFTNSGQVIAQHHCAHSERPPDNQGQGILSKYEFMKKNQKKNLLHILTVFF